MKAPLVKCRVSGTVTQNLRLPGQYYDVESGWNHNGFRDYMPALGRYIEPDPLGRRGSGNDLYTYVNDDPANLIDPLGLCPPNQPNPKCATPIMQPQYISIFAQMGKDLGINPLFMMSSALQESGWNLAHVYGTNSSSKGLPLNNLFGMTNAGGNNIAYPTVWASPQAWESDWGPYLTNQPQTIQDYAADLISDPVHEYNSSQEYPAALAARYKQLVSAVAA